MMNELYLKNYENDRLSTKRQRSNRSQIKSTIDFCLPDSKTNNVFRVPNNKIGKRQKLDKTNDLKNLNLKSNDLNNQPNDLLKESTVKSINNKKSIIPKTKDKKSTVKQSTDANQDLSYLVKYLPKNKTDLCVEKKKLSAIESWFTSIFEDKQLNNRILVLHGQTGCAKTTTIRVLAKHFNVTLYEFEEKTQTFYKNNEERLDKQHTQQIGNQFKQIQNFAINVNSCMSKKDRERKKAIVLKDLPSTFYSKVNEFHEFLRDYLSIFKKGAPIIFIMTLNQNFTTNDLKKLFPPEQCFSLGIHLIELNGVAKKQIRSVLEKINAAGLVSKSDLEMLVEASNGDLRSAIKALEFIVESDKHNDSFEMYDNQESNKLIAIKDTSPTFFHMLGKIMYCKRSGDENEKNNKKKFKSSPVEYDLNCSSSSSELSPISNSFKRRKLKENPEELVDHIDSTGDTLATFIHDCYPDFVEDLDNASAIISNLSLIDSHFSLDSWQYQELDDYMKLLAIRGTMFNLNTYEIVATKPKRQFKSFSRPIFYSVLERENKFKFLIDERSKQIANQFRSRDELIEILSFKERSLFSRLNK